MLSPITIYTRPIAVVYVPTAYWTIAGSIRKLLRVIAGFIVKPDDTTDEIEILRSSIDRHFDDVALSPGSIYILQFFLAISRAGCLGFITECMHQIIL